MNTHATDEYVRRVMAHIPFALPERDRIERDLQAHLAETAEGAGDPAVAIQRMGAPESVAAGYLEDVPRRYASVPSRVLAFVLDVALGLAVLMLVGGTLAGTVYLLNGDGLAEGLPFSLLLVPLVATMVAIALLSVVYFPLLEWQFGQTLGKRIVGIHVVREDGRRIGPGQAVVRRLPFFLEFFWIDAIVCLFTERKQRAFDLVARTVVTRVDTPPSPASRPAPSPS